MPSDEELPFIFQLTPLNARFVLEHSRDREAHGAIIFAVRTDWRDTIRLATGGKLSDLRGELSIGMGEMWLPTSKQTSRTVSWLYYHDGPAFGVRVSLPHDKFERIASAVRLGRLPSVISVSVAGMERRRELEGPDWDNKANPYIEVVEVRFSVPLDITEDDERVLGDEAVRTQKKLLPPTRTQFAELMERIDGLSLLLMRVCVLLCLIFALGIVVLIFK